MIVRPGQMRERVAFAYRDPVDDGMGNVEGEWIEAFEPVEARIAPLRGGETVQASRLAGRAPVLVTVWACDDTRRVTTAWRLRDTRSGIIYNIRSIVDPDEKGRQLAMECEAGVAN